MTKRRDSKVAKALRLWRTVRADWSWWYVVGAVVLGVLAVLANLIVRGPL